MSQAVPQKIVLKSTTKISLNERFSSIPTVRPLSGPSGAIQNVRAQMVSTQNASSKNRRLAQQMANRPVVQAALRLKKRSLKQRLGSDVRSRLNLPVGQRAPRGGGPQAGRGNRAFGGNRAFRGNRGFRGQQGRGRGRGMSGAASLSGSQISLTTTGSVAGSGSRSRGFPPRGRGVVRGMRRPRGGSFRGRSTRGGFRGTPQSGALRSHGRSRGRGPFIQSRGRGGRGFRRGGRGSPRGVDRGRGNRGRGGSGMSREQLDNQLDEYMSKTKGQLDNELDMYMSTGD